MRLLLPTLGCPTPPLASLFLLMLQGGHMGWIDSEAMARGGQQWYLRLFFEYIEGVTALQRQQQQQQRQNEGPRRSVKKSSPSS